MITGALFYSLGANLFPWFFMTLIALCLCLCFWRSRHLFQSSHTVFGRETPLPISLSRYSSGGIHDVLAAWSSQMGQSGAWICRSRPGAWVHGGQLGTEEYWGEPGDWVCRGGPGDWAHRDRSGPWVCGGRPEAYVYVGWPGAWVHEGWPGPGQAWSLGQWGPAQPWGLLGHAWTLVPREPESTGEGLALGKA